MSTINMEEELKKAQVLVYDDLIDNRLIGILC